jgi:hypothetical protein
MIDRLDAVERIFYSDRITHVAVDKLGVRIQIIRLATTMYFLGERVEDPDVISVFY